MIKSSSGKAKVRIDKLFGSKSAIGAVVSLDEEDKLLAVGNDDGDVKVILKLFEGCLVSFFYFLRSWIFKISTHLSLPLLTTLTIKFQTCFI